MKMNLNKQIYMKNIICQGQKYSDFTTATYSIVLWANK